MKTPIGNLGSFESFKEWSPLGENYFDPSTQFMAETGQISLHTPEGAKVHTAGEKVTQDHYDTDFQRRSTAPAESSINAGEIMTGIGTILAPLLQAGVGIYSAHQQMEMQQAMMKSQQRPYPGQQQPAYYPPAPRQKSPALMIVLGLVGIAVVGGMIYMMSQKDTTPASPQAYAPAPVAYTPLVANAPPPVYAPAQAAPQMRRVRRVRKRRKRRPPPRKK